ncbi:jg22051, partial [Pararge aegeria aegeria]
LTFDVAVHHSRVKCLRTCLRTPLRGARKGALQTEQVRGQQRTRQLVDFPVSDYDAYLQFVAKLVAQLVEVVLVLGHDVFGYGLVAAVNLVHVDLLLEEAAKQGAQLLRQLDATLQLAYEFTAQNDHLSYIGQHLEIVKSQTSH